MPVIGNMPAEQYHAHPAQGSSAIKTIALKNPATYYAEYVERKVARDSKALRLGTYTHVALLEPDVWETRYAVEPDVNGRTKQGKADKATFMENAKADGKTVIDGSEASLANAMASAIRRHKAASVLLRAAVAKELSVFWECQETGVECKARYDALTSNGIIIDLKTTEDASPHGFQKSVVDYGYDVQAAHYWDGHEVEYQKPPSAYVWLVVEKSYPHNVAVYSAAEYLDEGRALRKKGLELLCECRADNRWPGYSDKIIPLPKPAWSARRLDR